MTNNYERVPTYVNPVYTDLKSDIKYFLTKKNVRAILLTGYAIGAVMIILLLMVAYAVICATPLIKDEYVMYQSILMYASIWSGIFLLLPGIYCGIYTMLLKISVGERAEMSDLFKYYTSPRMYLRSVGIFARSNLYLLGIGCALVINVFGSAWAETIVNETLKMTLMGIFNGGLILYLGFGAIVWSVIRKNISIFLPYAIENSHVSLKQCASVAKGMNTFYYAKAYPSDFIMTLLWLLLSLATVGILFVVHVGPMMMAKKICFYRSSMVNKFN